jgi:hypothetical protein
MAASRKHAHEPAEAASVDTSARAREGLDHLQAAARELIAAARAVLDVADELVSDPEMVSTVVSALSGVVQAASRAASSAAAASGSSPGSTEPADHVERIRVS